MATHAAPFTLTPVGKIFGIGLNKTGTKSLSAACAQLGFITLHDSYRIGNALMQNYKAKRRLLESLEDYDAYFDMGFWAGNIPYEDFLRQLDNSYPHSKFIFHTRPVEDWIDSLREHINRHNIRSIIRRVISGGKPIPTGIDWEINSMRRHNHCNRVARDYFRQRSQELLVFDISSGDGWEKLCPFLDRQNPVDAFGQPLPFPHKGRRSERRLYQRKYFPLLRLLWRIEERIRGQ